MDDGRCLLVKMSKCAREAEGNAQLMRAPCQTLVLRPGQQILQRAPLAELEQHPHVGVVQCERDAEQLHNVGTRQLDHEHGLVFENAQPCSIDLMAVDSLHSHLRAMPFPEEDLAVGAEAEAVAQLDLSRVHLEALERFRQHLVCQLALKRSQLGRIERVSEPEGLLLRLLLHMAMQRSEAQ